MEKPRFWIAPKPPTSAKNPQVSIIVLHEGWANTAFYQVALQAVTRTKHVSCVILSIAGIFRLYWYAKSVARYT